MIRSTGCIGLLALLLAGSPGPVEAQVRRPPPRQELERQIEQRFHQRVRQELGLTEAQARDLADVVDEFQAQRRELIRREGVLRQRLRSTGTLLSDRAARAALEEMALVQEEEAALLRREQSRLLEVLDAPRVLRFYTLRAELAERIRRLRGGGPPGGGGPASGPAGTLRSGGGFEGRWTSEPSSSRRTGTSWATRR